MTRLARCFAVAALVSGLSLPAGGARADSPRSMMLELHVGLYSPDVDSQFATATPYAEIFGDSGLLTFKMHLDYQLWQDHGTLAIGGGVGYGFIDGTALAPEDVESEDEVGFNMVPLTASLTYRWDWPAVEVGFPLVPYVKIGFTSAIWWATNARGQISNTRDASGSGRVGQGMTLGWHAGGGIQFLLDVLSPRMATGFDHEAGVNNSYIFAEFMHSSVNDFGSSDSIDLSDTALSFGLMFEF